MVASPPPHLFIQVPQAVVEEAAREAAEAQVGAEARGAGQQGVGVHSGSLVVGNPGLQREEKVKKGKAWTLQRTAPRCWCTWRFTSWLMVTWLLPWGLNNPLGQHLPVPPLESEPRGSKGYVALLGLQRC